MLLLNNYKYWINFVLGMGISMGGGMFEGKWVMGMYCLLKVLNIGSLGLFLGVLLLLDGKFRDSGFLSMLNCSFLLVRLLRFLRFFFLFVIRLFGLGMRFCGFFFYSKEGMYM